MTRVALHEQQIRAAELLGNVLEAVCRATSDALYVKSQLRATGDPLPLDQDECARAIKRIKAQVVKAQKARQGIQRIHGGPQGTTGISSPVELAYDHAKMWTEHAEAIHETARAGLLHNIALNLSLDEPTEES